VLTSLAQTRVELAERYKAARRAHERQLIETQAQEAVVSAITTQIFPAWYGTAWDFNGTTETPGEGFIACGYFVSTVLKHAGLQVQRYKLAQQASERIVKTLAPPRTQMRFTRKPVADVVSAVKSAGAGLYVVGLDYHVGFLVSDGSDNVDFCHSSYIEPAVVVCRNALEDPAMASEYTVVGRVLGPDSISAWLKQTPVRVSP
jgi:hypothetical protein